MIFKTFDNDLDGITNKLGFSRRSFAEWGKQVSTSFLEAEGIANKFKNTLKTAFTVPKDYKKNEAGEIITRDNIDSYMPKLSTDDARNELITLQKFQEEINKTKGSWDDYNDKYKNGREYLLNYAKSNNVLEASVDDIKNANLRNRESTIMYNASLKQQTLGAKAASLGMKALSIAENMVAGALIGLVLSAIVNGLNDLTHAAENASKAADELYDKSNEKVEKNKEELESLDELIEKYKTLRNSNDTDVNTRKEIQEVQYKIADLVGEQAKNLDLVNGKLDDQLGKLKKIKANESKKAYDDAVTNYRNSVDASEKAIASGGGSELFGLIPKNYVYKGKKGGREDEAYNYLIKSGYKLNVTTNNNSKLFGSLLGSYIIQDDFNKDGVLKNAEEKMEFLQEMEDTLTQAGFRDTKMWTGIHTQIQKYEEYVKKETDAANSMLDAWSNYNTATNKKLTSIDVNSVNKLKEYRSTMIDLMKDDGDIKQALKDGSLTETDILTYVDNYIAADKQFAKWYNQYKSENEVSTNKNASKSSILKATVDNTKKELDDVKKELKEIKKKRENLLKDFDSDNKNTSNKNEIQNKKNNFDIKNRDFKFKSVKGFNDFKTDNSESDYQNTPSASSISDNKSNNVDFDKQIDKLSKRRERLQKEYEKYEKLYHYQQKIEKQIENAETLSSSWEGLDTTDNDELKSLKSDLTELAEAGKLSRDSFYNVTGAQSWLDSLGLSADYVVKKVNELVDSSKQLSSLKSGISQLQNALVEKKENKVVGADTLGNMESEFGNLKSWKKYKETLGSSTTDINACRDAQKELVTEYINSNNFLSQLVDTTGKVDEKTKQYYTSQLKEMGVKNAEQVINHQIKKQKLDMLIADSEANDGILNNIDNLVAEGKQLGFTEKAIKAYVLKKALASKNPLKTSDSIKNLVSLAKQCGVTSEAIDSLSGILLYEGQLKKTVLKEKPVTKEEGFAHQARVQELTDDIHRQKQKLKDLINMGATDISDVDIGDAGNAGGGVDLKDGKGSSSKDKDKSKNKSSKSKTKQEFDWIERRVTVLNNKISLLNAKKDNLFTVSKKNNNLKKQIKEMTKLLGTYSTAYNKYLQKANSVKLDSKLKSKVRNGAIKGSYSQLVQSYGEKIANRIQKYMDYYDKAKSSKESWETVQKQIHDAQVERLQNLADKYNDSAELNSARASKSDYSARTQNKYLTKQQKDLEKNYAYQIKIAKANGKINEAKKLQIELDQKLLELEKAKFDNIQNKYTSKLDNNTYQSNYVGNQVDIIEAKGMVASDSYYNKQISISKKRKTLLNQEHAALKKQLSTIERGTTEYYDALAALRDINLQQQENTKQEIEWNKAKAENNRKKYEAGQNRAGRRITENETLLSFIEHEDSTDSDTGQWTKAGKSRLWAYGYDLGVAQSKKTDSGKRLNELQKMLASGNYGEYLTKANLEEEIDKVISEDQANAKDVYTQRKNLADLVKDHYNQISNYLSDLISKAEESLDNQKDLYDYQKSLQEKTNNIDTIRKQLIALDGDSSEEAMAKKQQLKASLNESNEDLNSAIYDKYISDQKNILQKLQEDFKDFLEKYFKDFDALWKEGLTLTKGENGNYLLQKAKSEGNYTSSKETNTNTSNNKNQTSDQQGNKDGTGDIKTGKNLLTNTTTPTPPPDTKDPKLTKGNVNAWLGKKNALHKSGYDHLSFPTRNQKYSAVNKVISKNYKATSTSEDSDGKVVKKKVGLVLTNKQMAKLCEYVGVKTSKKYGKTSPLYKKLKSLGVKGFSKGGVVDVDDINKQVKANGDTTLISVKKGERILTPEQNKAFEKLVDTSLKNTSITSNLNVPNMANLIKSVPNNIDYGGFTFNFEVLANNPEDLVREVQTNLKYKEALKLATVGQLNGAGRLSVNRIK